MDHSPVLDGTLPVMPFDPRSSRFIGVVSGGSGTPPSVLALATEADGTLVLLNTVGYQTACSAHFAHLWQNEPLSFQPGLGVTWDGPATLRRSKDWSYQEIGGPLKDTPFVNALGLTRQANIDYGLKVPPAFPTEAAALAEAAHMPAADEDADAPPPMAKTDLKGAPPRFVFGNLHEATPAPAALHGHLRALRVVRLYDTSAPAAARCTRIWVEQLWLRGLARGLTRPRVIPSLLITTRCEMLVSGTLANRANAGFEPTPERYAQLIARNLLAFAPGRLRPDEAYTVLEPCIGVGDLAAPVAAVSGVRLYAVEQDPQRAARSRERFPAATILTADLGAVRITPAVSLFRCPTCHQIITAPLPFAEDLDEQLAEKPRSSPEWLQAYISARTAHWCFQWAFLCSRSIFYTGVDMR